MIFLILLAFTFNSISDLARSIAEREFSIQKMLVDLEFKEKPNIILYINSPSYDFSKNLFYYPSYRTPVEILHKRFSTQVGIKFENIVPFANFGASLNYISEYDTYNLYLPESKKSFDLSFSINTDLINSSYRFKKKIKEIQREIALLEARRNQRNFVKNIQKNYMKLLYLKELLDIYAPLYQKVKDTQKLLDSITNVENPIPEVYIHLISLYITLESRILTLKGEFKECKNKLESLLDLDNIVIEDSFFLMHPPQNQASSEWHHDSLTFELERNIRTEKLSDMYFPEINFNVGISIWGPGRTNTEALSKTSLRNLHAGLYFKLPIPFSKNYNNLIEELHARKLKLVRAKHLSSNYRILLLSQNYEKMKNLFSIKEKFKKLLKSALQLLKTGRISAESYASDYSTILTNYENILKTIFEYNLSVIEESEK